MVRSMLDRCTIADLYPELLRCEDGAPSIAYAHWRLGRLLVLGRQIEAAADQFALARRLAPTQVGEGTDDARWFGPLPDLATLLQLDEPPPPRVRLPAAHTVLALPVDVDDASIERALVLVLDGPPDRAPLLVLSDDDATTARVATAYERLVRDLAVLREPHVELFQVRPGELETVVQGNLFDGGTLLDVTGGPATAAFAATTWTAPIGRARNELASRR